MIASVKGWQSGFKVHSLGLPENCEFKVADDQVYISWIPTVTDVRDTPYLIPIIVQRPDLSGVVKTLAVQVQ